jgi:hypothetical protein
MDGEAQHATDPAAASALRGSGADVTPAAAHETLQQLGAFRPLCCGVHACARVCARGMRVPLSATKALTRNVRARTFAAPLGGLLSPAGAPPGRRVSHALRRLAPPRR